MIKSNLRFALLAVALCVSLFFSCTSDDPGSEPLLDILCLYSDGCIPYTAERCSGIGGQIVEICQVPSSSSVVSSSSSVPTQTGVIPGTPVDYEDEIYETVVIGTQTWMARNLNYNADGSECYDGDPANCATYGRLYDWSTAMDLSSTCNSLICNSQINAKHKGICPSDWHIPSNEEWATLKAFVGESSGTKLKATSGWNNHYGKSGNGTDDYGFAVLPGGSGNSNGYFLEFGNLSELWSATESGTTHAYRQQFSYELDDFYDANMYKSVLISVRCLKN